MIPHSDREHLGPEDAPAEHRPACPPESGCSLCYPDASAAPELLAACIAVLAIPANEPGRVALLVPMLRAAVAKARGEK